MTRAARILLVDDEPSIQKGLRPLLASRGYEVESATTGRGALEAFEQAPPDLIVLDLGLPDLDGCEVCRRVRIGLPGADHRALGAWRGCRQDRRA